MTKSSFFSLILPLCAFIFCTGFTFEIVNKPGSVELAEGLKQRDAMNYEGAANLFNQALSNALDTETKIKAMTELGKLGVESRTTLLSPSSGLAMLLKAEAMGGHSGYMTIGDAYHYAKGTAYNPEMALQYYRKATSTTPEAWLEMTWLRQDFPDAQGYFNNFLRFAGDTKQLSRGKLARVAKMYRDGVVVVPNAEQAAIWYRKAIGAGSVSSLGQLAKLWTAMDHEPASDIGKLWEQYAAQNKAEGQLQTGVGLIDGRYGTVEPEKGLEYLKLAAAQRPEYTYSIARFFEELHKLTAHPAYLQQQLNWYRKAAKLGNTDAMVKIARAFRYGKGEVMDLARAEEIYTIAASLGDEKAPLELAKMQENKQKRIMLAAKHEQNRLKKLRQKALKRDPKFIFSATLQKAKSGDIVAMRDAGIALVQGKETPQDIEKGMDWLNKAAFGGDVPAMLRLAKSYSAGVDGKYDLNQAYGWYEKAAVAGNAEAQYQLGLGYARDIGVEKDIGKAQEWLEKSNRGGFALAKDMLNTLQPSANKIEIMGEAPETKN